MTTIKFDKSFSFEDFCKLMKESDGFYQKGCKIYENKIFQEFLRLPERNKAIELVLKRNPDWRVYEKPTPMSLRSR